MLAHRMEGEGRGRVRESHVCRRRAERALVIRCSEIGARTRLRDVILCDFARAHLNQKSMTTSNSHREPIDPGERLILREQNLLSPNTVTFRNREIYFGDKDYTIYILLSQERTGYSALAPELKTGGIAK